MENNVKKRHPRALDPGILIVNIITSVLGVIIGMELIVRIGISTNTSIIGALVAILISYIPLKIFQPFKSIYAQNMIQTNISGATFSAANSMLLPIGIPYVIGRPDLVTPMLIGVILATIVDGTLIYKCFDTEMFPASDPWPPGIATAETILAIKNKGKDAVLLLVGAIGGVIGKMLGIPTDLFGVSWIGDMWALGAFGVGALFIGIVPKMTNIDFQSIYLPHGIMIGAGLVALIQVIVALTKKEEERGGTSAAGRFTTSMESMRKSLGGGFIAYIVIAILIALMGGLMSDMSPLKLIVWIVFAAFAAIASELIVGMAAMHSGWFPGFATALIFLIIGMLMGFPPMALALLVGYTAATGPAFADMGYDLKAGWILRGRGEDPEFEVEGRKQQYIAEVISFVIAGIMVALLHNNYFSQGLFAPVNHTYKVTIEAGASPEVAKYLIMFAIPGAIIQFVGGPAKQLGVLFATGLLVGNTLTGVTVLVALAIRGVLVRSKGETAQTVLYVLGAGFITGSALYSFFTSTLQLAKKS
ncbi:MAG: OPT family oligopeptide transporter [Tissierellia bacterium]|nr:OPT family oligopeptide transporter [Tissierellia bacterium]